jgi:ABC-type Mn2+/Zn2+ transport system ATPase subunit
MTPFPLPPGDVAAPATRVPLVTLEQLTVGYDRQPIVSGLNAQILPGTFTGLLGTNGSGKSTLLKTLLGILPPVAGRVLTRPGLVFGYVPQRESLDAVYLVSSLEVVLMGACGRVRPGRPLGHAEKDFARQCLAEVGAAEVADRRFAQLSGGQKQRVLIARALATRPGLLVLDEPTAGIDTAATQSILELLTRLNREQHLAILMVNHDLPAVRRTAQRILWIHHGELLLGSVEELLSRQRVEELMELGL